MKRFQFSLESVQKLRLRQLETEESRLAPMYRELETIEETARQLQLEVARETTRVADPAFAPRSFDLEILDRYRQFAARRTAQLTGEKDNCRQRIDQQLNRIREAERKHELLEKLRLRGLADWNTKLNKELDALADEVFIAKWKPRHRRADE
jgi:flagellar export protein FliJ